MSHVATVDVEILDLDSLALAAQRCGLELVRDQQTYKWYGRHVGDYPLPAGFSQSELGKCEHALRIPGNTEAYEVGVVRRRDGRPGYSLLWDFWQGGLGLEQHVGKDCSQLRQAYSVEVATKAARLKGFRVNEQHLENGKIKLSLYR